MTLFDIPVLGLLIEVVYVIQATESVVRFELIKTKLPCT